MIAFMVRLAPLFLRCKIGAHHTSYSVRVSTPGPRGGPMPRAASTATTRRARTPLSRERVLAAAIELADEAGIGALTMRRLAQELGVEAMTLYYYVANKPALLKGMVDLVESEIKLPTP